MSDSCRRRPSYSTVTGVVKPKKENRGRSRRSPHRSFLFQADKAKKHAPERSGGAATALEQAEFLDRVKPARVALQIVAGHNGGQSLKIETKPGVDFPSGVYHIGVHYRTSNPNESGGKPNESTVQLLLRFI
jgi:hypothetical protein